MEQPESLTPNSPAFYSRFPRRAPRPKPKLSSEWVDVDEVVERLGLSPATVYRRISSGALDSEVRAGRTVVTAASLDQYLARLKRGVEPRDRRRLTGEARPKNTWRDREQGASA